MPELDDLLSVLTPDFRKWLEPALLKWRDEAIAQEANKAYQTGYNTGWQKANRKHKRVWRQINDLKSTIDGIGELEGEAQ